MLRYNLQAVKLGNAAGAAQDVEHRVPQESHRGIANISQIPIYGELSNHRKFLKFASSGSGLARGQVKHV